MNATNKKFPNSFRKLASRKILFRLVNTKRGKSFDIFEANKFATTIEELFSNSSYRSIDYAYDTRENNKLSSIKLIVENVNDTKDVEEIKSILKENREFLANNKSIKNIKAIEENIKFFESKISTTK
jgi:hypothetical protein